MIDKEKEDDAWCRKEYGEKWNRVHKDVNN